MTDVAEAIRRGINWARLGVDIAQALYDRLSGDDDVLDLRVRDLIPGQTQLELAKQQADAKAAEKFGATP